MDELEQLKELAGLNDFNKPGQDAQKLEQIQQNKINSAAKKKMIEREQNIKPGTNEWFKLWFDRDQSDGSMPPAFRGRKRK